MVSSVYPDKPSTFSISSDNDSSLIPGNGEGSPSQTNVRPAFSISASDDKEPACNAGDLSLIPGLGRSPGERNGYPLQNIFVWRIPWTEEHGGLQFTGVTKSRA